jgi:hypothetical protein
MYFAAWSHNVVSGAVQLSMDLKLGEYRVFTLVAIVLSELICNHSQNSSPSYVHHPNLRYYPRRVH